MTVAPPTSSRAMPRTALVLGANSDIARATLARLAEHGLEQVVLAARDPSAATAALAMVAPGLDATGVRWDATDATSHAGLVAGAVATLGRIDLVLCTVGVLGHGAGLEMTPVAVDEMIRVNLAGCAAALAAVAPRLADQSHGTIVVLSSVAGVRPRRSNYVYGATKAGLDAFAFGLADALHDRGVRVVVVRPGFVRSKMTTGLRPAPFATDPVVVASAVEHALARGRRGVVWVPPRLGPLFTGFRLLPAALWRRVAGDR